MTILKTLCICLFCFLFLTACSNDKNEISSSAGLVTTKQITELPIGADTPPKSNCLKYFSPNENEEYLFFLNKKINSFLIFDLVEEKQVRKTPIQKEGGNGMGRITGFTIRNMDSIYLSSAGRAILYLTDTTGLIKEKYDFSEPVGNLVPSYSSLASRYNLDVFFREDQLLISQPLYLNGRNATKELLKNHRMYLGIDPESHTHQFFPITPPEDYFEKGTFPIELYSIAFDGEKVVWSFSYDHSLYFSKDLRQAKSASAKSRFIDDFVPIDNYLTSPYFYYAETPQYCSILYDPYREVFYRFAKHALTPDQLKETGEMQGYNFPPRFSVLILDKDLHVLGETPFFGNNYNMFNSFVGRKGLYISTANPLRTDFSEDFLRFELFELIKI